MHFLLVEDNERLSGLIVQHLRAEGHSLAVAASGPAGLELARAGGFDAIIMDRMLPGGMDGLAVIAALRGSGDATPILILSALSDVDERIRGLRAGGDDYLPKPFAFGELLVRLEVLARRGARPAELAELTVGDLVLDTRSHRVVRAGRPISLTNREYRLLEYLMRHAGQAVTRAMLLENVWEYDFDPETNVIDVQISKLRQKIDSGFARPLLHTIRSVGYRMDNEP